MSELEKRIYRRDYYAAIDYARQEGVYRVLALIKAMSDGEDANKIAQLPFDDELLNEMYEKYHITRWYSDLTYRVNPICPRCEEEHLYFDIQISEEEQQQVEDFYAAKKNCSSLTLAITDSVPMTVTRKFKCPCCDTVFEARVQICREFYQGRRVGSMQDDSLLDDW